MTLSIMLKWLTIIVVTVIVVFIISLPMITLFCMSEHMHTQECVQIYAYLISQIQLY